MNDFDSHKKHVLEYKKLAKKWRSSNLKAGLQQVIALGGLHLISRMDGYYVKPVGILLGAFSIFFIGRDYVISRFLDRKVVATLLEGLKLEKRNANLQKFFLHVLQKFSVFKILVIRALTTVLFVSILAHKMNKILFGEAIYTKKSRMIIGLIGVLVGVVTCVLYYQPYDSLEEAKRNVRCS